MADNRDPFWGDHERTADGRFAPPGEGVPLSEQTWTGTATIIDSHDDGSFTVAEKRSYDPNGRETERVRVSDGKRITARDGSFFDADGNEVDIFAEID